MPKRGLQEPGDKVESQVFSASSRWGDVLDDSFTVNHVEVEEILDWIPLAGYGFNHLLLEYDTEHNVH
jgi:hypothetical protein